MNTILEVLCFTYVLLQYREHREIVFVCGISNQRVALKKQR